MELRGATVLVTGGAGFIGSHLVERLVHKGCKVRVLDDLSSSTWENLTEVSGQIEIAEGSVLDPQLVRDVADGAAAIFHCAAITGLDAFRSAPEKVAEVNTLGFLRVLEAARRNESKLIFSSSSTVYGNHRVLPTSEQSPTSPTTPYAIQKISAESYVRCYHGMYGLQGRSLRYFNVYGPRQNPRSSYSGVVHHFLQKALTHRPIEIFGNGANTRDFIYVEDVARANISALLSDTHDVDPVNVGTGQSTTILQVAKQIVEKTGSRSQIIHRSPRPGDVRHSLADCTLALERIGFISKTGVEEGLDATVRYYRLQLDSTSPLSRQPI